MAKKKTELSIKDERFLALLLEDKSQREAYREAFPHTKNWKDETVDVKASVLFNSDMAQIRWRELKDKLVKKAEEEGLLSATEVLKKLTELIIRNENTDDRVALDGIKAYMKNHGLLTEKVEVNGKQDVNINFNIPRPKKESKK